MCEARLTRQPGTGAADGNGESPPCLRDHLYFAAVNRVEGWYVRRCERVLSLMTQQTARMTTLVEDLLTLAKLEGSPRPTCERWTPVARLFSVVESEARGLSSGRHTFRFTMQGSGDDFVTEVIQCLSENRIRVTDFRTVVPSLEDVFVELTYKNQGNGTNETRAHGA